jgi:hypothetical protein
VMRTVSGCAGEGEEGGGGGEERGGGGEEQQEEERQREKVRAVKYPQGGRAKKNM